MLTFFVKEVHKRQTPSKDITEKISALDLAEGKGCVVRFLTNYINKARVKEPLCLYDN